MYLSTLLNVFLHVVKYIFTYCKTYLFKLQNQILLYWQHLVLAPSGGPFSLHGISYISHLFGASREFRRRGGRRINSPALQIFKSFFQPENNSVAAIVFFYKFLFWFCWYFVNICLILDSIMSDIFISWSLPRKMGFWHRLWCPATLSGGNKSKYKKEFE